MLKALAQRQRASAAQMRCLLSDDQHCRRWDLSPPPPARCKLPTRFPPSVSHAWTGDSALQRSTAIPQSPRASRSLEERCRMITETASTWKRALRPGMTARAATARETALEGILETRPKPLRQWPRATRWGGAGPVDRGARKPAIDRRRRRRLSLAAEGEGEGHAALSLPCCRCWLPCPAPTARAVDPSCHRRPLLC